MSTTLLTFDRAHALMNAVTGTKLPTDRARKLFEVFEEFAAFAASGASLDDRKVSSSILSVGTMFSEQVVSRGGALVQNEIWVVFLFLYWLGEAAVLNGEESKAYKELKDHLQESDNGNGHVTIGSEGMKHVQNLLQSMINTHKLYGE